jgi:hypothetical protein
MRGELTEGWSPLREPLPLPIRFSHGSRAVVVEGYSTGCDTGHGATRGVLLITLVIQDAFASPI